MKTIATLAVLLCATTAHAQLTISEPDPSLLTRPHATEKRIVMSAMVIAAGADLGITAHCLGAGTCREANGAMAWATDSGLVFGITKMAGTAAMLWFVDWLYDHQHPNIARFAGWLSTGVWGGAAAYNAVQLEKARRKR